jgi:heterodisulfide reductase subunit A
VLKDGRQPQSIAILHCIGSRDEKFNRHCSRVCCITALKFARLVRERTRARVFDFYIDMRTSGKGYEEFYEQVQRTGVIFVHGKGTEVIHQQGKLLVRAEDTLLGRGVVVPVDMVILAAGLEAQPDAAEVARLFGINCSADGFFEEKHPKLAPVETATAGVFIAGACQGPKDIPDTVAQAKGAASEALALSALGEVEVAPMISSIDPDVCIGCQVCIGLCPYSAIEFDDYRQVSVVNEAMCKGCGSCAAYCPSGAAKIRHFTDKQIFAEIEGILAA